MSRPLFSQPTLTKARRLLADHKVAVTTVEDLYRVAGDHGSYLVSTDGHRYGVCDCAATVTGCAHLAAVLLAIRGEVPLPVSTDVFPQPADPFVGIA